MIRSRLGVFLRAAGPCLAAILALSPGARAVTASPEKLRDEAARLFAKARASGDDKRKVLGLAAAKVTEAIGILTAQSSLSKGKENLLLELRSLRYWIAKMTPLQLDLKALRAARPPDRKTPKTVTGPPVAPPKPTPRPTPIRRPASHYRGLPAHMAPLADAIRERYERGYVSVAEVDKMRYQYFLRDLRQVVFLRRHPGRPLEAAALIFQATDEFGLNFTGSTCSLIRMQACLELDRLERCEPGKDMTSRDLWLLKSGYTSLATCPYDFDPAVERFETVMRSGVKHPDAKLGLALAKLGQAYIVSQATVAAAKNRTFGKVKLLRWFGPGAERAWTSAFGRHQWSLQRFQAVVEESRRLFKEYAKLQPRGDIYEAYSECFWHWYYKRTREFNAAAARAFASFDRQERSDAEETVLRVLLCRWMRKNGYVDSERVKWE